MSSPTNTPLTLAERINSAPQLLTLADRLGGTPPTLTDHIMISGGLDD